MKLDNHSPNSFELLPNFFLGSVKMLFSDWSTHNNTELWLAISNNRLPILKLVKALPEKTLKDKITIQGAKK